MAHTLWSKEKIKQLIELLHDAPALWDIKSKEFHDRDKKSEEMQNISNRLNVSEEEVAKKIKSVKTQYRREYTKQLQQERNGLSSSSREKEWFGYKPLSFLRKNITSKEIDSPEQEDTGEEDNDDKDDGKSSDSSDETIVAHTPTEKTYSKIRIKKEQIKIPETTGTNQNLKRKIHEELFNDTPKRDSQPRIEENKKQITDDFTVYGENVASRLKNSRQGYREIAIAKHEIDNILFRLEMGEFR